MSIIETENIINIQYDKLYHYKYFLAELKRLQTELTEQLSEDTSQSSQTYLCPADQKGTLVDEDFLSAPDTDEDVPSLEQFEEMFYLKRFQKIKLICYIIKQYFRVNNVKSLKFTEIFSFLEEFKNIQGGEKIRIKRLSELGDSHAGIRSGILFALPDARVLSPLSRPSRFGQPGSSFSDT